MNKEETLALYNKGREVWNVWAKEMLARRDMLIETGEWTLRPYSPLDWLPDSDVRANNRATIDWFTSAKVDFSGHTFETDTDFTGFVYPGDAKFTRTKFAKKASFAGATFSSEAWFEGVTFSGRAGLGGATFSGRAWFGEAMFNGEAWFEGATFSGGAWFAGATFSNEAWFEGAAFSGGAGFEGATFSGKARFARAKFSGLARFAGATFSGGAEFKGATFSGGARFEGSTFSDAAMFRRATFSSIAWFEGATFSSEAWFVGATFSGEATFGGATFSGGAWFGRTMFSSYVWFGGARFRGNAGFDQATFEGIADFSGTIFQKEANFVAVRGESFFTLKNARFLSVPDFEQAHFAEAPRLDHSYVQASGNEPDIAARWRALRRLAVQGHDHERELIFLAEEIKSLRGVQDWLWPNPLMFRKGEPICWPGGGRYWFGLFYQWFPDFGRSTFRPFLWWMIVTSLFALFYFDYSASLNPGDSSKTTLTNGAPICDPPVDALYLSIHNGLVISGLGRGEKLAQSYACLYGNSGKGQLIPIMPNTVVLAGIAQTIFSAVLIFLFLLGLRNYFRIK